MCHPNPLEINKRQKISTATQTPHCLFAINTSTKPTNNHPNDHYIHNFIIISVVSFHRMEIAQCSSSSPEFEFWMVSNHPELEPDLHTADELFVDGVLLPLHKLSVSTHRSNQDPKQEALAPSPVRTGTTIHPKSSICSSSSSSTPSPSSGSKRWKDMFKKKEVTSAKCGSREEDDKKKEKNKSKNADNRGNGTAELNINIWPFSRSRSAGTAGPTKPAAPAAMRKSSSAPCSRSNSQGESKGRRWAASPGRPGVHVGRASPVWQVKRAGKGREPAKGRRGVGGGARGLSLNVNGCIGYRNQGRCREEERDEGNGSLFRLKALFAKKVY